MIPTIMGAATAVVAVPSLWYTVRRTLGRRSA